MILALLGASAGLSGLVLVFLGLVAAATASFPPGTKPTIVNKARNPAYGVLTSFGLGILCVSSATGWLILLHNDQLLYILTVGLFFAQLVTLVGATVWSVRRSLWG